MRNFEVVQGLSDFTKIWDVFLVPIISSGIICLFTYFLFGKEFFCDIYRKYGLVKISNKYYKQKYIKVGKEKKNNFITGIEDIRKYNTVFTKSDSYCCFFVNGKLYTVSNYQYCFIFLFVEVFLYIF